jgi:sulfite reductase alpha subunit-like flavoprotein
MVIAANAVPTLQVMENAIATNRRLGHENLGSLSYTHGFLPPNEPLRALPSSHRVWDEAAAAFPSLLRNYSVRRELDALPLLSANDLPDEYLVRASSIISIMAHLYWYSEPNEPEKGIPLVIQRPWEEISRRLDRIAPHLSFIDLNTHNWLLKNPDLEQPYTVENFMMAVPMTGNEDERRFQMTPVEMLYLFSPLMKTTIDAQTAVIEDNPDALAEALVYMGQLINHLNYKTFMKANPNPYSDSYINPVVWGKTAAPFAAPFNPVPGPSGTAVPSFTMMDIFFGRKAYQTTVGHETQRTRDWFPKHWREWLDAVEAISIPDYVYKRQHQGLIGVFNETRDCYIGENGLLNRHRLKAYGFLDLSFKAGRVKTLGGVSGEYSERVWDRMADELDDSRKERYGNFPATSHMVTVKRVESLREHEQYGVKRIVFDVAGTGIRYQAGDRCAILPENSDELLEKTLKALLATGDEPIVLNAAWRHHMGLRYGYANSEEISLRDLLRFGRIRPVGHKAALNLYHVTKNERLLHIIDAWALDQWELWDLLELVAENGYNPKRLWKAVTGDYEHICRIIPPERWRIYSISSVMEDANASSASEIHLTVSGLRYQTEAGKFSNAAGRLGTGSSFLARLANGESACAGRVSIKVIHPPRFSSPSEPERPIVMFAGGTGLAPMRSLINERIRAYAQGENWLFFGTRTRQDFYYQSEFETLIAEEKLNLQIAFSQDDVKAHFNPATKAFDFLPAPRRRLDSAMLENAEVLWKLLQDGAIFYICGRTEFANTILETLKQIISQYEARPDELLYRLVGEERLLMEIFTSYTGPHFDADKRQFSVSELILHNDDEHGYWLAINGRVYDMNRFGHMHPGGLKIIQSYSGMDATFAYEQIEHQNNPEVDSMLGMYELGVIKMPDFEQVWGIAVSKEGMRYISLRDAYRAWVDLAFIVVEMENAILSDFRTLNEAMTDIETLGNIILSPFKLQQIGLAHHRLMNNYLEQVLGESLETLWAISIGILKQEGLNVQWMQEQIAMVQSSDEAASIRGLSPRLNDALKMGMPPSEAFCTALIEEDLRVMRELKLALRDGLNVFESLGTQTIQRGSEGLLAALRRIPNLMQAYYERFGVVEREFLP